MTIDRGWPLVVPAAAGLLLALGPACAQEPRFAPDGRFANVDIRRE
jgi:hypothetical protein